MTPLALAALAFGLGFGSAEHRRFETRAADEIRSKLTGPNAHVEVSAAVHGLLGGLSGDLETATIRARDFTTDGLPLYTEPDRSRSGRIRNLRIELERFSLGGLRVERLEASIPDCRYDFGLALRERKIRLSRSGLGTGYVKVAEVDLEAYVLKKFREIKQVDLTLNGDRVLISGYGEFVVFKTRFFVVARLVAVDGTKLALADADIFFEWRRAEPDAAKALLSTLNPVIDLATDLRLLDAVHVDRLSLSRGWLEAWGSVKIPDRPN